MDPDLQRLEQLEDIPSMGDVSDSDRKSLEQASAESSPGTSYQEIGYGSCPIELQKLSSDGLEMDFNTVEDDKMSTVSSTTGSMDRDAYSGREMQEIYQSGVWIPHPEHFLPENSPGENEFEVFAQLQETMELITPFSHPKNYVYKRLIKDGCGIPVGQNDIVSVHFLAFLENGDEPVDVAYSRSVQRKFTFSLDKGSVLPGFELAVKSMTPGEQAIFIVSSSLAYGNVGCPPRYPGGADIFYYIELISSTPGDDVERVMNMSSEEREELTWDRIRTIIKTFRSRSAFFFENRDYRRALRNQKLAVELLEFCRTADEKEDEERLKLLVNAYSNAAVISRRSGLPKLVLYYTRLLLQMDKTHQKALRFRIEAHMELKGFSDALTTCTRALSMYPSSTTFNQLLPKIKFEINAEKVKEKAREKALYQRMMGISIAEKQQKSHQEVPLESSAETSKLIEETSGSEQKPVETVLKPELKLCIDEFRDNLEKEEEWIGCDKYTRLDIQQLQDYVEKLDLNFSLQYRLDEVSGKQDCFVRLSKNWK